MAAMQINWREIIFDLKRIPMSNQDIVDSIDGYISERQLRDYAEEISSPGHFRGELLVVLWMRRMGRAREQAPLRPVALRSMPGARAVRV
ncbi:hypothetical protein [Paraburkholderia unamae]|uniref:Uncharacterized protein n=1 Tax=Paraburkholderia unamae TaxID=219649 RepID=A0ABX5KR45_9BURK|nr:hypothetical protein [Paraburkholderia unamae]PVX84338.1 hypothetical protein C7402_105179 [Paraburkholderia unamae]